MPRPTAFLTVGALAAALGLVSIAPAQAATTTVQLDSSTPGHVTGTATTSSPYGYVALVADGVVASLSYQLEPVVGGQIAFDEETWGLRTDRTYTLRVGACADDTFAHCTLVDTAFTPTDLDPEVSWSSDRAIGPGESPSVTVSDPGGGGWLQVGWGEFDWQAERLYDGENHWWMPDGAQTATISRCSQLGCRTTGQSASYLVDTVFAPTEASAPGPRAVHPDGTTKADATGTFALEAPEPVTLDWHLVRWGTTTAVPGVGGTVSGIVANSEGTAAVPLDLTGTPDGGYRLVGTMSYDSADFGHRSADVTLESLPVVDTVAPTLTNVHVAGRRLFPAPDGYQDEFRADFETKEVNPVKVRVEYLNRAGTAVDRVDLEGGGSFTVLWYGRSRTHKRVPAGTYRVQARVTDAAGNTRTTSLGTVAVSWQRLVSARVTRRVSASASEIDRWTGKCSSITRGGSRHVKGALGLMSNTRCSGKAWRTSGVATAHAIRVPKGWRVGTVAIDTTGGAARSARSSRAVLEHLSRSGRWVEATALDSRYGRHGSGWVSGDRVIRDEAVIWRVSTAIGYRYDVASFKVTFSGVFLR